MKFELLRDQLAQSDGSIGQVRTIATNLGVFEDRHLARPAAELMVQQGAPGSEQMAATMATMPITGKDYKGDILRAAFRAAMEREGIPPAVEAVARGFYERRQKVTLEDAEAQQGGGQPSAPPPGPPTQPPPPEQPQNIGDALNDIAKKLFG